MNITTTENTPNAARLIDALRSTGYDNFSAIADIVDNSIDADATKVWVDFIPVEGDFRIVIADNGQGMDKNILDQALRLGSLTERDAETDLGKFGMGLVTASISIGKKLKVITKFNKQYYTASQDLDIISVTNKFEKLIYPSSKDEIKEFDKETHKSASGTVVIIENCDHIQNKNINQLCNTLNEQLGRIFRLFIKSKKEISLRGDLIKIQDPLMIDENGTKIFSDESFEVDMGETKETVRVRIAMLPEFDYHTARSKGVNINNQGFYLMRNSREIATGKTLGIFPKHNDFNRLRMEIYFNGKLDALMGVNFTKKEIRPKQSILDKINQITFPQIKTIRGQIKRAQATDEKNEIDHEIAAKVIFEKSKLLIKPKVKIEIRKQTGRNTGSIEPKDTNIERIPKTAREKFAEKVNCQFLLREMRGGNIFESEQVGKKTIIYYNIDHPFYQSFISENKDNQEVINALDFLVYSLASAKLIVSNDENSTLMESYESIFSSNLRTLIS